ncbi:MAG: hypothetical protein IPJ58_09360 [Ardenticatenia bacterium]|nr:hypothetical protein [Ardenticatenia bacterium]
MAKGRGGMMMPGMGGKQPDMMRQLARMQEQMLAEQEALADGRWRSRWAAGWSRW